MITVGFENIHVDGVLSLDSDPLYALISIVSDFSVSLDGRVWYTEEDFCVLEFADYLAWWLGLAEPRDLVYASAESEEPWLIRVRRDHTSLWCMEAVGERFSDTHRHEMSELRRAAAVFFHDLSTRLPEQEILTHLLASEKGHADLLRVLAAARV